MARLKQILHPDEALLLREGRSVWAILAWLVAPAAPFALVLWFLSSRILVDGFLGLLTLIFGIFVAIALFSGGLQFLIDFAFIGLYLDHWRIAVTDRRVLVRRGLLGMRRDEIARDDITTSVHDRAGGKLVLAGAGRELVIACSQAQAGRICKALGREAEGVA